MEEWKGRTQGFESVGDALAKDDDPPVAGGDAHWNFGRAWRLEPDRGRIIREFDARSARDRALDARLDRLKVLIRKLLGRGG